MIGEGCHVSFFFSFSFGNWQATTTPLSFFFFSFPQVNLEISYFLSFWLIYAHIYVIWIGLTRTRGTYIPWLGFFFCWSLLARRVFSRHLYPNFSPKFSHATPVIPLLFVDLCRLVEFLSRRLYPNCSPKLPPFAPHTNPARRWSFCFYQSPLFFLIYSTIPLFFFIEFRAEFRWPRKSFITRRLLITRFFSFGVLLCSVTFHFKERSLGLHFQMITISQLDWLIYYYPYFVYTLQLLLISFLNFRGGWALSIWASLERKW